MVQPILSLKPLGNRYGSSIDKPNQPPVETEKIPTFEELSQRLEKLALKAGWTSEYFWNNDFCTSPTTKVTVQDGLNPQASEFVPRNPISQQPLPQSRTLSGRRRRRNGHSRRAKNSPQQHKNMGPHKTYPAKLKKPSRQAPQQQEVLTWYAKAKNKPTASPQSSEEEAPPPPVPDVSPKGTREKLPVLFFPACQRAAATRGTGTSGIKQHTSAKSPSRKTEIVRSRYPSSKNKIVAEKRKIGRAEKQTQTNAKAAVYQRPSAKYDLAPKNQSDRSSSLSKVKSRSAPNATTRASTNLISKPKAVKGLIMGPHDPTVTATRVVPAKPSKRRRKRRHAGSR